MRKPEVVVGDVINTLPCGCVVSSVLYLEHAKPEEMSGWRSTKLCPDHLAKYRSGQFWGMGVVVRVEPIANN